MKTAEVDHAVAGEREAPLGAVVVDRALEPRLAERNDDLAGELVEGRAAGRALRSRGSGPLLPPPAERVGAVNLAAGGGAFKAPGRARQRARYSITGRDVASPAPPT